MRKVGGGRELPRRKQRPGASRRGRRCLYGLEERVRRLPVGGVGLRDLKQVIGVVDVLPILARALVAVRNAPDSLSRSGSARACENVGPPLRCFDCWEKPSEKT